MRPTVATSAAMALVLAGLAVSEETTPAPSEFEHFVPATISPQAQEFMRALPDPSSYPSTPVRGDLEGWRKAQAAQEQRAEPAMAAIRKEYQPHISHRAVGGVPVLDIRPRDYRADARIIVFVHGGGYTMSSAASSLGASVPLAADTGIRVVSVDYTLAPFASYSKMLDQVITVIEAIQTDGHKPENIAMVGV